MRFGPPTDDQLRAAFKSVTDGILAGNRLGCPTGLGFDNETFTAINRLALSPKYDPELLAAAQTALAAQISGLHNSENEAALAKALDTPGA